MTLPSSGTLTTAQVSQELYGNSTTVVDLTGADARALVGKSTGTIVFPNDFWGKSKGSTVTIGSPASGDQFGYMETSNWNWGTITPVNATVYPDGRLAAVGALGHIFSLAYSVNAPHYGSLVLRIGGTGTQWPNAASLPFTSLKIGATTYLRSVIERTGVGDHGPGVPIVEFKLAQGTNPFVRGNNTIQFLP